MTCMGDEHKNLLIIRLKKNNKWKKSKNRCEYDNNSSDDDDDLSM